MRVALLLLTIKDLLNEKNADLRKNARLWVDGKISSHPGFSFMDVCDILDIDSEFLLNRINSMDKNKWTRAKSLKSLGRILVRASASPLTTGRDES